MYKIAKTAIGANLLNNTALYNYLTCKKTIKNNDELVGHIDKEALELIGDDGRDWYSMFNDY